MIEIKNVTKRYGKKNVINNMNLDIPDGCIFGFIGPNAAGKTTTISMITGLTNITNGDICINNKSIKTSPVEAKKEFGFVPDSPDMFLNLKVKEFLSFIADIYEISQADRETRIKSLLKEFEVEEYFNTTISELSHGTRQKIVIISVLLHEPNVWILDEPMTGLDPNASFRLKQKMKEHAKKGKTVFFSTHVLEVAEKLCDVIAIINKGEIIYQGTYEDLRKKYPDAQDLEELFINITGGNRNV